MTVFLLFSRLLSAQEYDLIVLKDGNIIKANIIQVTPREIGYKYFDHPEESLNVIPKVDVLTIKYGNNRTEIISTAIVPAIDPERLYLGISINPTGFSPMFLNNPSISFDIIKGRFYSIINLSSTFGFFGNYYILGIMEYFGISPSFNYFHPSRIGGFYIGGMLEYSVGGAYSEFEETRTTHQFGLAINTGYKFVTQYGMYFRTGFAGGWSFANNWDVPIIIIDLSLGYSFLR